MLTLHAADQAAQEQIGGIMAEFLPAACVVYLRGDLGAGKTTLVRGILRGMGHPGRVKSPTYTLLEPYQVNGRMLCHFDLYRVAEGGELEYLGLRDLLGTEAVLLFEWPERGAGQLPDADLEVDIRYQGEGRRLEFSACSDKGRRLLHQLDVRLDNQS